MESANLQVPNNNSGFAAGFPEIGARLPACDRRQRMSRSHYRRPRERPLEEAERDKITILIGGLTRRHERFIKSVFEGCGYNCEILPEADYQSFHIGKEYGNNGQCSPAYFTGGALIGFLKDLEARGMPRQDIVNNYVFFTAGSCGPCRFATYSAEYRLSLQNAGFDGFRVVRFQQDHGINQKGEEPGLKYTVNFGLGMLKALYLGDAFNDIAHNLRPYEAKPGEVNRVMDLCVRDLCDHLRNFKPDEILETLPPWLVKVLSKKNLPRHVFVGIHKMRAHLYGKAYLEVLERCRARINNIEIDRLKVKPIVKIVGEFWAQTTETEGNYRMFDFLENEGAQVQPEPIGTWPAYLLTQARFRLDMRRGMNSKHEEPDRWDLAQRLKNECDYQQRKFLFSLGERLFVHQYHRLVASLGHMAHQLLNPKVLAQLADPYYHPMARGGEGYLEVGKNIYYTINNLCHMVLSLKPFGCMPSSQSDGVQSAVVNRHKNMIFLPIETSGEGENNAHSRVQMALGEAKAKAKAEFQEALDESGRSVEEIRAFAAKHPALRRPQYKVPRRPGIAGVAANFVLHVSDLMAGRTRLASAEE
jgi:predicted nucleotide-binding protein (sugar kinase/HSP70/actin superfamily)